MAFATETIARAHLVNDSACVAVRRAAQLVRKSIDLRRERRLWHHIWAGIEGGPERVVAICAYCQRVRTHEGEWGAIPARIRVSLGVTSALTVTHGICYDCVTEHFPMVSLP